MFYTIYKITNKINNKFYIGMHKTDKLDDGYMGSGKLINRAIKKYGKENFTKEILHVFDNEEEMKNKEKELVVLNEMSYNLCDGGKGGFGYLNRSGKNLYGKNGTDGYGRQNLLGVKERIEKLKQKNKYGSYCEKLSKNLKDRIFKNGPLWLGKKHSLETKKHIGQSNSVKQIGHKNSQYGTCWITNGHENKKIKKEELDIWIDKGYYKGRIIKPG